MKKLVFILSLILVFVSSCSSDRPDWGYNENNGPDQWSSLSSEYSLCGIGQTQSPIDIETSSLKKLDYNLKFNYENTSFKIVDTGNSIQFNDELMGNTLEFNDFTYHLEQIHFHNESENTIDGKHYPLEAHFVHRDDIGENLVVSVMFDIGEKNEIIGNKFEEVGETVEFNPNDLLPTSESNVFTYDGSLTTPPCSENVKWIVFEEPLMISQEQLDSFTKYYSGNSRNTQKLNNRVVGKL